MKALITGGAGFIGSHISEKLLARGDEVVVLDNLSTGRHENVYRLQDDDQFNLIVDTIMNEERVKKLVDQVDVIFHLAAAVGVQYIIDNPLESMEINSRGTENILHAANQDKTPVFLASTSEIYGKNEDIPFKESQDRVLGSIDITRWSYSCTKAFDEFLGLAFWRQKQLPVVIGRFFNTVGPRQTGRYGMVIPRFVNQALLGHPITIYGDGQQSRAFMDVDDTTDAVLGLMDGEQYGEFFNIGSEERVTIEELAEIIVDKVNSDSDLKFVPYDEAYEEGFEDMRHRVADTTKLKQAIDFTQKHDLDDTLDRIIEYFRSNEDFE
ncbi:MAG: SDR family NAD(P)-dependent oxidoreductase [bacterium]